MSDIDLTLPPNLLDILHTQGIFTNIHLLQFITISGEFAIPLSIRPPPIREGRVIDNRRSVMANVDIIHLEV